MYQYLQAVDRIGRIVIPLLIFFTVLAPIAHAVSSDFVVRTLIGDDTTPPTVPTGLTATPVAMTQIDLAWNASTDDYLLSGYQVFRDGLQVATTTGTNYSDIGLTASTTYAYHVTAFDAFNNISASSSLVSTTTFATPTPPVVDPDDGDEGGTSGTRIRLGELTSLTVIPSQRGAVIRYETDAFVRSIVRWGTTISYELGSSAERSFSRTHEMRIDDLVPGTRYRFMIEGENERGRNGILTESSFMTLPEDDTTPPGIVTGLTLVRDGDDVIVAWQNPSDDDFARVRVMRSESFFPGDGTEGWLVYEGDDDQARDAGVAAPGKRLFYTVFTYDKNGNISGGAVASLLIRGDGETPVPIIDETLNPLTLTIDAVRLYQDGEQIRHTNGTFTIDGGRHLTIAIPYDLLPEHLKTVLVTIIPRRDEEKELNFLLRVNEEKTAYTARLAPFGTDGDFLIRVTVFDFKTTQIGYTQGRITSLISNYVPVDSSGQVSIISRISTILVSNYVLLFILFLLLLAFLARKLLQRE
jgi:hypothetical protein